MDVTVRLMQYDLFMAGAGYWTVRRCLSGSLPGGANDGYLASDCAEASEMLRG